MSTNQNPVKQTDTILIVDDETDSLRLMTDILSKEGYRVRPTERPKFALESAMADPPGLILLDVRMPEMSGFELSRQLKQDERTKDIPIIFVSGLQDSEDRIQGFEAGGVDFISKPFKEAEVLARVRTHISLRNMQLHLEELVVERTAELEAEIAERKQAEEQLRYQASLLENISDAVVSLDTDFKVVSWNDAAEQIYGWKAEEALGKIFRDLTAMEYPDENRAEILEKLHQDSFWRGEVIQKRKNGEQIFIQGTVSLIKDNKGNTIGSVGVNRDITEHKRAEVELKQSEERFQLAFKTSNIAICLVELDGRFIKVNNQMCSMYGYTKEELESMTIKSISHPEDLNVSPKFIRQAISGEIDSQRFVKRYRHKDGHIIWGEVSSSIVRDDQGNPLYFISYVLDITENKRAEDEKEVLLHDIGERLKELNCIYTISNSIRMKQSLDEIFQDTANAIPPGWHYPDITRGKLRYNEKVWVSEPFEETAWKQSSDIVVGGKTCGSVEVYYLEECPTLDEGPFMEEERDMIDIIAQTLTEAIDRRESEENLQISERKYRELVDNSLVGVFTTTLDGKFLFVNDALVRMYDFDSREQMMNEGSLSRWSDPKRREQMLNELQEHGSVSNFEAETITRTGRHIHVLFSAKQQDESIAGMVMDITKRKHAEKKILEHQERLSALSSQLTLAEEMERRRIATDLHDHVSQSLALSCLQLSAAIQSIDDAAFKKQLDELNQTLISASKDTRNLIFDLSSPTMHELGLGAAIGEWIDDKLIQRHGLDVQLVDKLKQDNLDLNLSIILFRSVRELLTNVVKHARADQVNVLLEQEGNDVRITVKDNGIGFSPEQARKNVSAEGGLGLFSIEERMTGLGGSMVIDSKAHHGTTIVMTTPLNEMKEVMT